MKKLVFEFFRRGCIACGFGPIILAILYLILKKSASLDVLHVNQVCIGIFSLSALAFVAGGMNVIYQIERLPLMIAVLIHGSVLYVSYLGVYLVNGWLSLGKMPIFVFTLSFILGYMVIWAIIYGITKRNTKKVNIILKEKQRCKEETVL